MNSPQQRPNPPGFWEATKYWLILGFISFGGPAGQIAMMHQELVEKRRWISEQRFLHALNYCMLLPGPEAQQLAIYLGWLFHRTWGGVIAGTLFVLPSLLILSALSYVYLAFGDLSFVQGLFNGIKPAVVAIVVLAAWRIGSKALKNRALWALAALAFFAIFALNIPFPYIVLAAALAGFIGGKVAPQLFKAGGGHTASQVQYGLAAVDDDTPPPPHASFRWSRLLWLISVVVLAGGTVYALLPPGTLTDMAEFFTKAALVTFGGAYAVLPYVYQGAVENYHWLNGTQMIDGLALGETTPGPLIMVVAFVAFVGAWSDQILGPGTLFLAGLAGASVATFFTFLPSFLFILAGAPLVESTHGNIRFTAPLTAITAAVVGVIVNLALFFGWHVIWPRATEAAPFSGGFEWFYTLMSCVAFVALWKYQQGILRVISASAIVGLIYTLLR